MVKASMPRYRNVLPYRQVSVEVVIPVYNEEVALLRNIPRLCSYMVAYFPYRWSVVIADNASTDSTLAVAQKLAAEDSHISVLHLDEKGRGRALKAAWLASHADIVAYMDVDLSTNLWSFLPLIAPLASGHSDLAIGSRLLKGATVTRQWKREAISRCYNLLVKLLFGNHFSDAQCGFKAIRADVATALADLRGVARLSRALVTRALPLAALRAWLWPGATDTAGGPGIKRSTTCVCSLASSADP